MKRRCDNNLHVLFVIAHEVGEARDEGGEETVVEELEEHAKADGDGADVVPQHATDRAEHLRRQLFGLHRELHEKVQHD